MLRLRTGSCRDATKRRKRMLIDRRALSDEIGYKELFFKQVRFRTRGWLASRSSFEVELFAWRVYERGCVKGLFEGRARSLGNRSLIDRWRWYKSAGAEDRALALGIARVSLDMVFAKTVAIRARAHPPEAIIVRMRQVPES